jgi:hypothetical protein
MLKLSRLLPLIAALVAIAGCGSHHAPARHATAHSVTASCLPGGSAMGCSVTGKRPTPFAFFGPPAGPKFPDVSSYQGHPDWAAAKRWGIVGAAVKAGEYTQDPDFAWNVSQLRALHIPWVPYWFVRSCDPTTLVSVIRSAGLTSGPVILDMEVPSAAGCAPTLNAAVINAFHRAAVIYTAPGTWPGGSNAGLAVWEATYGASFSPIWHPVLGWQFTDGQFGAPVYIPGIGTGDVSVDYGLFKLAPTPDPYAAFPKTRFVFGTNGCPNSTASCRFEDHASEYNTVKTWDAAKCRTPVRRVVCKTSRAHLILLRQRDWFVAHHTPNLKRPVQHPRWADSHLGWRWQQLVHRTG